MADAPIEPRTQVVILGGGFAGTSGALALGRALAGVRDVDVHLVSEENYCVFQPMLPEVVSGGIEPTHIVSPIHCANANQGAIGNR